MATIKIQRKTDNNTPGSLLHGELGVTQDRFYFGDDGAQAVRVARYDEIPIVNNATLTLNVSGSGLSGSDTFTANQSSSTTFTVTSNATAAGTGSTIAFRDASGGITAGVDGFITDAVQMKYNTTTLSLDFIFS